MWHFKICSGITVCVPICQQSHGIMKATRCVVIKVSFILSQAKNSLHATHSCI